jgi:hypothetical protein
VEITNLSRDHVTALLLLSKAWFSVTAYGATYFRDNTEGMRETQRIFRVPLDAP